MRVALLTTDTPHHLYYAWKVHQRFPLTAIFLEGQSGQSGGETANLFESDQFETERRALLAGFDQTFGDLAPTRTHESLNSGDVIDELRSVQPELMLVFGTGRLIPEVFGVATTACLNLHGGNPERYRGLDTHLWAIYHRDFDDLVTTLHHVDAGLDTGDIVLQTHLPLQRGMSLHELRTINTRQCVELTTLALSSLDQQGWLPSRRQVRVGRYYSAMPSPLKDLCITRFKQYVQTL